MKLRNAILAGMALCLEFGLGPGGGLAMAGSLPASLPVSLPSDPQLIDYDWSSFANPAFVKAYTQKYHLQPTYQTYADDSEAYQRISAGKKVDIAHPCTQMIGKYRQSQLIAPWDIRKIPHFKDIDKRFLASSVLDDSQGVWYIPTEFAYTAIAYDRKTVPAADVASLQVFTNPKYKGRIALPNNPEDVFALALLATGVTSWNHLTDAQFNAAANWLRKVNPNVMVYWTDPDELAQLMESGQVSVAWAWNDTIRALQRDRFPVGFQRSPKEGASVWYCGYVNIRDAPGSEQKAYDFINAFLAYATAPVILKRIGYATTESVSMSKIPLAVRKADYVNMVKTTLLFQTPLASAMRNRMSTVFEQIKSGS